MGGQQLGPINVSVTTSGINHYLCYGGGLEGDRYFRMYHCNAQKVIFRKLLGPCSQCYLL